MAAPGSRTIRAGTILTSAADRQRGPTYDSDWGAGRNQVRRRFHHRPRIDRLREARSTYRSVVALNNVRPADLHAAFVARQGQHQIPPSRSMSRGDRDGPRRSPAGGTGRPKSKTRMDGAGRNEFGPDCSEPFRQPLAASLAAPCRSESSAGLGLRGQLTGWPAINRPGCPGLSGRLPPIPEWHILPADTASLAYSNAVTVVRFCISIIGVLCTSTRERFTAQISGCVPQTSAPVQNRRLHSRPWRNFS